MKGSDGDKQRDDEKDGEQQTIDDSRHLDPFVEHHLVVTPSLTARCRVCSADPQVLADVVERGLEGAVLASSWCRVRRRRRVGVVGERRHVQLCIDVPRQSRVRLGRHAQQATETTQEHLSTERSMTLRSHSSDIFLFADDMKLFHPICTKDDLVLAEHWTHS